MKKGPFEVFRLDMSHYEMKCRDEFPAKYSVIKYSATLTLPRLPCFGANSMPAGIPGMYRSCGCLPRLGQTQVLSQYPRIGLGARI